VADVPSEHSLIPPQETKKKNTICIICNIGLTCIPALLMFASCLLRVEKCVANHTSGGDVPTTNRVPLKMSDKPKHVSYRTKNEFS
jgi:hypothetical protein